MSEVEAQAEWTTFQDVLIYLPGLDGTGQLFYRQASALARRYRIVSVTYRTGPDVAFAELVADLEALVASLVDARSTTLCAESFGGAVALAYAARNPGATGQLVIANGFPGLKGRRSVRLAAAVLDRMPHWLARAGKRPLSRLALLNGVAEADRENFYRVVPPDGPTYANRLRMLAEIDLWSELRAVGCPVVLLAGAADRVLNSVRYAQEMARELPRARVRVLKGVGHLAFLSHRLNLAAIIATEPEVTP